MTVYGDFCKVGSSAVVLTFQLRTLSECNGMGIALGVTRKTDREGGRVKVIISEWILSG